MRVKNKEIRQRRHRKEQKIKEAQRALRLQYGDKKTATAPKPKSVTAKKAAPAKTAESKPKVAPKAKKTEE